jgi:hypothetical protein
MTARMAALAFFLGVWPWTAVARASEPTGAVYVTTLPASADIWLDGTYVGRAPVLVDALALGHHVLTITHAGWRAQEVDVTVAASETAMSSTRLVAEPGAFSQTSGGSVVIRDAPPGATLTLDGTGTPVSVGHPMSLSAGTHRIAMTTPKGRTTREFTVLPDTSTDLVLRPDASTAEARSPVLAPADDYVGADAYTIEGTKIVVRTGGHVVIARFGDASVRYDGATIGYDAAPTTIGGKLYLPLALLEKLSNEMSKSQ